MLRDGTAFFSGEQFRPDGTILVLTSGTARSLPSASSAFRIRAGTMLTPDPRITASLIVWILSKSHRRIDFDTVCSANSGEISRADGQIVVERDEIDAVQDPPGRYARAWPADAWATWPSTISSRRQGSTAISRVGSG